MVVAVSERHMVIFNGSLGRSMPGSRREKLALDHVLERSGRYTSGTKMRG